MNGAMTFVIDPNLVRAAVLEGRTLIVEAQAEPRMIRVTLGPRSPYIKENEARAA